MCYSLQMETMEGVDLSCEDLSEEDEAIARDVVSRIADKWALWILYVLSGGGTLRFSRVREQVEGISQKMLTKTLRELERDGFLSRTMFLEVPPRVEYALTPLGEELLLQVNPLYRWIVDSTPKFTAARALFDNRKA
jgi:DNA-binding HxlR family transcriptional regulator